MAGDFNVGRVSTLKAQNALATDHPITMAGWHRPLQTASGAISLDLSDTLDNAEFIMGQFSAGFANGTTFGLLIEDSGGTASIVTAGTPVIGGWSFVMGRFISTTNRWIHVLNPTGVVSSTQDTTSIVPSAIVRTTFGGTTGNFGIYQGLLAEMWIADADVYANAGTIDVALFRQIAQNGPFSVPSIAGSVVEYIPMAQNLGTENYSRENYYRAGAPQTFANVGVLMGGDGPPLSPAYKRPSDFRRILDI